ncbi:polycystin-1 isoform X2 [Nothobranchius furzeri]|uniref:polycystin-1 isoform X2 n=1 Tax=Nothobranchius furzeri TaxID=105023 RepID=UPI0039048A6E
MAGTPFWSLWVLFFTTARGEVSCPDGGKIHLDSLLCFWLSDTTSSWYEAQDSCRMMGGGNLAAAQSKEIQNFIHYHFTNGTSMWTWLNGLGEEGPEQFGVGVPETSEWWDRLRAHEGLCPQMALGNPGRWRRTKCDGQYRFICENRVSDSLPSPEKYLIGLVLMTGVYTHTLIQPLPHSPDTGQHKAKMLLFPGLWFSHAGQLVSVELVVQPSPVSSLARVQILRPYCSPNHHLVPPGCSSLLNPFSCCSAQPLCNTTGGCSVGHYWCHLLEVCVPNTRPCSPYDTAVISRGFTLPPRYPALPPFYHLVADLPLDINPCSKLKTLNILLPERDIMVYPDDIVAVQHNRDSGAFLHCLNGDAATNSPWRQSYLLLRREEWGGWWERGLTSLPRGSKWMDEVVCDLRILYEDKLHRVTEQEEFSDPLTETTTASYIRPQTPGPIHFTVNIIYPQPDENNRIHLTINIPTMIVVKALVGEKATSSWSAPVLQTEVPFHPSCPEPVVQSIPDCKTKYAGSRFSSVMFVLPSLGVHTLNISVGHSDRVQTVEVHGYEAVMGLTKEPHACQRTLMFMPRTFTAKVESGSQVKFTWMIDNLGEFAHEGESCRVTFEKAAEYKLQVTASNPVSSQSLQILLTAEETTPLTEPQFLSVREVMAINVTHTYTFRVKVDIALPVAFKWDFGDGSEAVVHTHTPSCQSTDGLLERGQKQAYVQDSVNHSFSFQGNYTLHVEVFNQFMNTSSSMRISALPQLSSLHIFPSTQIPLVKETLYLEAAIKPSTLTVLYTWDFGDASKVIQGLHEKVNHSFESAGVYSVVVFASNSVSSLAASLMVIVMEKVSGLTVTFSSPSEAGAPVDFRAQVATGSDPIWGFDFGDESVLENLTDGYISHIYAFPGKYRVGVSASNAVSQARLSVLVEVYSLTVSGVLPTDCVMSGKDVQLTALVNGNVSSLSFHWTLGKDSLSVVMNGKPTVVHTFPAHGIFPIRLTVFSSFASVSLNSSICVESPIANVELQTSRGVVAVQEQVCLRALVSPEQTTVYQFMWFSSSSGLVSTTENSKCFAFSSEGDEEVFVVVSNKVSNKTAKTIISTQKPVSELTITHDSQSDALAVNKSTLFWVARVVGSNVSVVWDFGDGSPIEKKLNMSHVFYSTGTFTVTATAFNSISRDSAALNINVLLPVSDLSLHTDQLYAVVGQQIVITAVSSDRSITNYYWTVEGDPTEERTPQFQFISSKPGVFEVRVTAQNLVSKREEAVLIEVHEIIEGLQIECQSITDKKYIPTHEEILFTASVIKGSNITYHWLVAQRGVIQQQDGELFHVVADTPGRILVRLKASNILGQVISGVSLVAVERVTGAHLATQSSIVATGTAVNMTVFVNTGSHLQYRWYVNTNTSSHLTHEPFFLYTFTDLGLSFITVSVQNVLSQSRHTKQFTVQEEIRNVDFTIDGKKRPFSVNVSTFLSFHGFAHEGSGLHWTWKVKSGKENIFTSTDPTFTFRLVHIGMYLVSLNVSNDLNWQMTSHSITAQEPIKGFLLNISKTSLCTHEQVVFVPTVTKGSNVSFFIALQNKDKIQTQEIFGEQFATSNLSSGRHLVTVKALNLVSSAELSSSIVVTESIQGLHLINCCLISLEAKKGARFKAEVQTGSPINYTWTFQLENSEPMLLFGQEVNFTALESGLFSVTVHASDGACSQTIHETVRAEWPIRKVKLVCHSERIFVGQAVSLFATVIEGSSVRYLWDFGDSTTVLMTTVSAVGHVYNSTGKYTIAVKVFNSVSHVSTHLEVEVEALRCSSPQASLVQNQPTIFRSRLNFFEASVTMNCSAYKTSYLWEIFRGICLTNGTKVCLSDKDAALPLLILPKHSLHVGEYCLQLTVSFKGTPLAVQQETNITVVHSQLVAVIQGGSSRLWPYVRDLVLDGSGSHDPDVEPGVTDTLQYHWTCLMKNSTESPPVKLPIESTDTTMTVLSTQLHPGTLYIFILTVHKNGTRSTSVNQTVTVAEASVLPVTVTCVSCSASSSVHHVGPTTPAVLKGVCGQCDHQTLYKWRAEDQNGMTLDLSDIATSTGTHSPSLVVRSGVLHPGRSYSFFLNVSQSGSRWRGGASLTIETSRSPRGGVCALSPESGIRLLETVVTYNCSGWHDDESKASQLIYTFQVAPCWPVGTACPMLTLYRGTRTTFGCLVPLGSPGELQNITIITVTIMIEDHQGAKVTALNRTLVVEDLPSSKTSSGWLGHKSQMELVTLVQHGNPQEIIPYSIALISKLNQMKSGGTAEELRTRREIRESVSRALASVPVSSLQTVEQLSSALTLSTVVPAEMVSEGCQETVLAAVETMIRVVEHQICPVGLTAVDLGRNLLDILGNTLAAVSESSRASSSHQTHSGSLKAASVVTSALTHAGALMRALMHSRVLNEEPLSFSNGYIRTAGFFGDPFGLLCLHQSNQFTENLMKSHSSSTEGFKRCPFLIPASLSAHLKTQSSEVVQVLLGMDAKLESDPFLDAANPPISTTLVAMELNSPQGRPLPIQDLTPEQAIQITLPNKYLETQDERGRNGKVQEAGNRTCPTATLANAGQVNFTVKVPDNLDENAGLYISFNFSLAPGGTPVRMGHIRVEVMMAVPGTNASQDSLVRQWALTLSAVTASSEETIFLSPLLNGTDKPISVSLAPSLNGTGPVQAAACVFSSLCRYYNVTEGRWSSEGLQPLEGSTLHAARCLTQHLTMFGASVFVHPGSVILLPPADGPMQNTVVGIVCAVLVMLHLLAGLIALKMDHLDRLRLSQVPLCGRSGLYQYRVLVKTGLRPGAGTTAHVGISLFGVSKSGSHHLQKEGSFQRGGLDQFQVETYDNLGEIWKIRIWHDNTGLDPSWYIKHVVVWDPLSDHMYFFLLEDWLSVENQKNQTVEREVLASCPAELTQFPRVLTSQLIFGMAEHHLWLSLWERPNHSSFTRAQRVTCSALVLHLYLALGTLWFGAVGIAGHRETVAMGMSIALLVFPLQCFLCFLFRNVYSQVTLDSSAPPSLVCQSVEMDIWDSQSHISSTSFVSPQDSDCLSRSPSSLLESKALDSSIMNFWTSSGLVPLKERPDRLGALTWQSHDSLLCSLAGTCPTKEAMCRTSPATRQLKRKKAIIQLHLALPPHNDDALQRVCSPCSQSLTEDSYHLHKALVQSSPKSLHFNSSPAQVYRSKHLTLSEEDLLMSVAAEGTSEVINSNSDSGRDSPRTTSSFSASQGDWSDERSSSSSLYGGEAEQSDSELDSSSYGTGFYKCSSLHSMESLASTFLPQPLQESIHPSSTTRIGVARGRPRWLLPSWVLHVVHPLMALLVVACLAVVGLYGSLFSRAVVIMLLVSVLAAFLTSALLLEPLKVCVQALTCTLLWRSVDPEVEELLAQEAMVVRASAECGGNVRPPCGYGLQQAKQEARKIRALHSLMRHCVCQLGFLLLVLMVNYQDRIEQRQASLLHSAIRQHLHSTHPGSPNLTSLRDWSDAEWWIGHTLIQHLHQNPTLDLVGLPQVRFTHTLGASAVDLLGNNSSTTQQLLTDLHMSRRRFKSLSLDFTHHHRASALFLCVSIRLELTQTQGVSSFLTIHSLHLPSSVSGPSLHVVLTICFCTSALLIVFGELWSMLTERARYFYQCRHWFQLLLAFVSLMTAFLQLWFLSLASLCVSEMQSMQESFIDFHSAALLAYRSSQCAAVLLTLLALKLLGTLRFVRRWVMMGRVLQRASRELWAAAVLVVLLLLICSHLGNMLFHQSVEGFLSVEQTWVSVTSMLRSRRVLGQLCRVHPVLGPLYGLLVYGGSIWLLARLCGAVLIHVYREKQMELLHSTIEPQDYEMVEFFIKRLKLWMGLTKAKQFRHSVKFEDMDTPPSRSSQGSAFSTLSSSIPSSCSPSLSSSFPSLHPPSSVLSVTSEDFLVSKPNQEVQPCLDGLEPIVSMLLSSFDRVSQLTEDIYNLEVMLHEAQERQRKRRTSNRMENERIDVESAKPKEPKEENVPAEVRHRKIGLLYPKSRISLPSLSTFSPFTTQSSFTPPFCFPRVRSSYSESESAPLQSQLFKSSKTSPGVPTPMPAQNISCFNSYSTGRFPRRRAWHSGSSHSADPAQRTSQSSVVPLYGGETFSFSNVRARSKEEVRSCMCDRLQLKRKAWISEGPEREED